jgi:phage-related protein
MLSIGPRCRELRVRDEGHNWRIIYRIDDAIVIAEVFDTKTRGTPRAVIVASQRRLRLHDKASQ